jgi:hypothetical protein
VTARRIAVAGIAAIVAVAALFPLFVGCQQSPTAPVDRSGGGGVGDVVQVEFRCSPQSVVLTVFDAFGASLVECIDGTTGPYGVTLVEADAIEVSAVAGGDLCPVSPCGWASWRGMVPLRPPACPVSPCSSDLVGTVRLERMVTR